MSSVSLFPTGIGTILWVWIFVAYILYHILMFPWCRLLFMTLTCHLIKSSSTLKVYHIFSTSLIPPTTTMSICCFTVAFITNYILLHCVLHQQYTGVCVYVCMCMCLSECAYVLCECCIHLCPCICFLCSAICVCLCVKV